jgi:hypothetical protein
MYSKINNVNNKENIKNLDKKKIIKNFGLKTVPFINIK